MSSLSSLRQFFLALVAISAVATAPVLAQTGASPASGAGDASRTTTPAAGTPQAADAATRSDAHKWAAECRGIGCKHNKGHYGVLSDTSPNGMNAVNGLDHPAGGR